MNPDNNFDKIEDYLNDMLTREERVAFEKEITTDEALALEVEKHKLEHTVIKAVTAQDLLKEVRSWDLSDSSDNLLETAEDEAKPNGKGTYWVTAILIAAFAFGFLAYFLFIPKEEPTTKRLAPMVEEDPLLNVPQEILDSLAKRPPVVAEETTPPITPEPIIEELPTVAPEVAPIEQIASSLTLNRLNDEGLGFAGDGENQDSIVVIYDLSGKYESHYRFKDTLFLYLKVAPNAPQLDYDVDTDLYYLTIGQKKYVLERGYNAVYELKEDIE